MGNRLKPTANSALSPFKDDFVEKKVGFGQDNIVRALEGENIGKYVVKISRQKGEGVPTNEEVFASTLYKKKKYEILKTFLGDSIPDSRFVVGHKTDGIRPQVIPKSYTIQDRVPQYKLADLTEEQRGDPRLLRNMYVLLLKLKNMYSALDQVNSIMGKDANPLDGKLDLGGISDFARKDFTGETFDASTVVGEMGTSPNLLVDPESMNLYCIDFDDGVWSEEKEAAKGVLSFVAATPAVRRIIDMPINNGFSEGA